MPMPAVLRYRMRERRARRALCSTGSSALGAVAAGRDRHEVYSTCIAEKQQAKQENVGVHAHGCRPAWEWRMLEKLGLELEET